jgi:hypothetical protein
MINFLSEPIDRLTGCSLAAECQCTVNDPTANGLVGEAERRTDAANPISDPRQPKRHHDPLQDWGRGEEQNHRGYPNGRSDDGADCG